MKNILVTAIGSFSAYSVINGLKNEGYKVIGCDINARQLLPCSKIVDAFYQVPYASNESSYIYAIIKICKRENIDYLFPLTDVEIDFLNKHRKLIEKNGTIVCISPDRVIKVCRNKMDTFLHLKSRGILNIIDTNYLYYDDCNHYEYPFVIKPYNGRSSEGLAIIKTEDDFIKFKETSKIELNKYIVQPYIEGNIVTVDLCRDTENDKIVCLPRIELLRSHNGAGLSVKIIDDEKIIEYSRIIARALGVVGTVNFEFIKNKDNALFLECNPRFSGGVGFSILSGYDFIGNHLKCFQKREISDMCKIKEEYMAKQYIEVII